MSEQQSFSLCHGKVPKTIFEFEGRDTHGWPFVFLSTVLISKEQFFLLSINLFFFPRDLHVHQLTAKDKNRETKYKYFFENLTS